jgi:RNA polymerase sigma-70 factor (ECF subfamily)
VGAPGRDDRSRPEPERTLADVLYGDRTPRPVPEKDWVALVQSIATRDQRALQLLYERTHRLVFTLIVRIVNSRETAEEVTLDVFQDVWRRAPTYEASGGSVLGWIMNQARSRAIDRLRFEQRKKRVVAADGAPVESPGDPDAAFGVREQGRRVRDAMTVLTPAERAAIETAFFGELTYEEAAGRLREPVGTVKTRIRSGLAKLRQALGETARSSTSR